MACELASKNMKSAKIMMKGWYDKKTKNCLLKWEIKYCYCYQYSKSPPTSKIFWPYLVMKKVNEVDYIIHTPDR